jgi:hypothetical protein
MKKEKKIPLLVAIPVLIGIVVVGVCLIIGFALALNRSPLLDQQEPTGTRESCVKEAIIEEWSGSGNRGVVEILSVPCPGAVYFVSGHRGEGLFSATLNTQDGERIERVALCSDECEREEVVNLDPGNYLIEIENSGGSWVVVVGQ